jgi:hypothetical protein
MADEDKPKRTPVQPDKLNLPAPRPRNAAPSYPQPVPGGSTAGRPAEPPAATSVPDPARQKLDEQAERRRAGGRASGTGAC